MPRCSSGSKRVRFQGRPIATWLLVTTAAAFACSSPVGGQDVRYGRFRDVSAGDRHTCALAAGGPVICWGVIATEPPREPGRRVRSPFEVPGTRGARALASGSGFSCAIGSAREVLCWGQIVPLPMPVAQPWRVSLPRRARQISAGDSHACAVLEGGQARCWGVNGAGQLGDGTTESRLEPARVRLRGRVLEVASASMSSCARTADGDIWCWGIPDVTVEPIPVRLGPYPGVVQMHGNGALRCAVERGGTALCWGANGTGQLGDGTTRNSEDPVSVQGLSDAVQVEAGLAPCARRADGTVTCWGEAPCRTGDWDPRARVTPTPVAGITDSVDISVGSRHACSVGRDGAMRCWGNNLYGQLGDGTSVCRPDPVPVVRIWPTRPDSAPRQVGTPP